MGVVQRELIGKVNGSNVADVIDEYNKRLTDEYCPVPACLAREPGFSQLGALLLLRGQLTTFAFPVAAAHREACCNIQRVVQHAMYYGRYRSVKPPLVDFWAAKVCSLPKAASLPAARMLFQFGRCAQSSRDAHGACCAGIAVEGADERYAPVAAGGVTRAGLPQPTRHASVGGDLRRPGVALTACCMSARRALRVLSRAAAIGRAHALLHSTASARPGTVAVL